jgi:hypothetical protein
MAVPERNERLTATLRVVVAGAALVIFVGDPSEHPGRRPLASGVLALFAAYSVASYVLTVRRGRSLRGSVAPWIDAGWVTLAVAVSAATSEIFYPLYLFAILCASFWGGSGRGSRWRSRAPRPSPSSERSPLPEGSTFVCSSSARCTSSCSGT